MRELLECIGNICFGAALALVLLLALANLTPEEHVYEDVMMEQGDYDLKDI